MVLKSKNLFLYALVLVFTLALNVSEINASTYINYFGISMTEQQYENLTNLGFSENEIYYMDEETFNINKDTEATLEVVNEKYYKTIYTNLAGQSYSQEITKDEYETQGLINPRGSLETAYKRLITSVSRQTNTFRFKETLTWKRIPAVRSYDIIGIGFEDYDIYQISSPIYFNYTYCDEDADCTTSTQFHDRKSLATGGSAVYKVPSGDIRSLQAVLYYDVSKINSGTVTSVTMCGDYAHATTAYTSGYDDYTVNLGGIQLNSSIYSNYDAIDCVGAYWSGTW